MSDNLTELEKQHPVIYKLMQEHLSYHFVVHSATTREVRQAYRNSIINMMLEYREYIIKQVNEAQQSTI